MFCISEKGPSEKDVGERTCFCLWIRHRKKGLECHSSSRIVNFEATLSVGVLKGPMDQEVPSRTLY